MVRKIKQIVRIREKKLNNNTICLYMDIYYKGKRTYEFPGLYLIEAKTSLDKKRNTAILMQAEDIRSKLQVDIVNENYGFDPVNKKRSIFLDFFTNLVENKKNEVLKQKTSKSNYDIWWSTLKQLRAFTNDKPIPIFQIDETFLINFQDFLLKKYKDKTAALYYEKLVESLKELVKQKIIKTNPATSVDGISVTKKPIIYLTQNELQQLGKTSCDIEILKRAFLFTAITGIRFVDLKNLTFSHISYIKEHDTHIVTFVQQKTEELLYHPIPKQAIELIGTGSPSSKVFEGLKLNNTARKKLRKWIEDAGIVKNITFHKARHTYATTNLTYGSDLYLLSKLLGHNNIASTQVYGAIIDPKKIEAVKKIPRISII